jgi:hypothetical protein
MAARRLAAPKARSWRSWRQARRPFVERRAWSKRRKYSSLTIAST